VNCPCCGEKGTMTGDVAEVLGQVFWCHAGRCGVRSFVGTQVGERGSEIAGKRDGEMEGEVLLAIKLPVPVKTLAVVVQALVAMRGDGVLFMREAGPVLEIIRKRKAEGILTTDGHE